MCIVQWKNTDLFCGVSQKNSPTGRRTNATPCLQIGTAHPDDQTIAKVAQELLIASVGWKERLKEGQKKDRKFFWM